MMKNNNSSYDDRNSSVSNVNLDDARDEMQHHRDEALGMHIIVLSVAHHHHC